MDQDTMRSCWEMMLVAKERGRASSLIRHHAGENINRWFPRARWHGREWEGGDNEPSHGAQGS
jgi:hypothetical protein